MPERRDKVEGGTSSYKSTIKLSPAIGDWTTLKVVRAPSKKVKTGLYGFDSLSQEELKKAHLVHYNFAAAMTSSLKRDLMTGGELFSVSVEQSTYSDFLKRIYQPTVYSKISVPGLPGDVIVCIDMPLANTIINHALGGGDLSPITRKLTDIEEEVLMKVMGGILDNYVTSFEKIFERPALSITSSPEITVEQTISPTATFVFFSIEISVGDNPPSVIWIGYTSLQIKTLLDRMEKRRGQRPLSLSKLPQTLLEGISIPVIADLGSTEVLTGELHSIEPGDVVSLSTALGDFIPVSLGGKVRILGRPGERGGKISVRAFATKPAMGTKELPVEIPEHTNDKEKYPVKVEGNENLSLENPEQQEYPVEEEGLGEELGEGGV